MFLRSLFSCLIVILFTTNCCFSQFTVNAGTDQNLCPGQSASLGGVPTATGGKAPYTYNWAPSASLNSATVANPTASLSYSMSYTLTVTDDTGAVKTDIVNVYMSWLIGVSAGNGATLCEYQTVEIGSQANNISGITYSWSPGSTLNDSTAFAPIASPGISSTTYTMTATTAGCPPKVQTVTINVIRTPLINAGPDTTIKEGEIAILNASGGFRYAWGNTPDIKYEYSQSCDVEPKVTTTYYLYGTDETGQCPGYDQVTVFVEPSKDIVIYNTFTPNGDGNNDTWYIGNIQKYPDNSLEVFNRYGKLVYKTNSYLNSWDGRVGGEQLPSGTYFYDLDLGNGDGKFHGTITIIK
jgi:gliding motility-associated-like protein